MPRGSLRRTGIAALALACVLLTGAGISSLAAASTPSPVLARPDQAAAPSAGILPQNIFFTSFAPSPATVGGTYTATVTATSSLAVTLTIDAGSTAGACAISGSTVSLTGPGTCVIDANQAGNGLYAAAAQVQQSFPISPAATVTTTTSTTPTTTTDTTMSTTTPGDSTTTQDSSTTTPAPTSTAPATPAQMSPTPAQMSPTPASSAGGTTPAASSAPRMTVAKPTTTTSSASAGNQKISLTFPRVATCLAASAKLKVGYMTAPVSGSPGAQLTYVGANFSLDRRVRGVALSTTRTFLFALRGLKRGTHTLTVDSIYHEQIGRETLTVTKTITHRFKVC